jgi:hypothetical protein
MELVILLNTILLCTVNTIFMLTGVFLNSTVICIMLLDIW